MGSPRNGHRRHAWRHGGIGACLLALGAAGMPGAGAAEPPAPLVETGDLSYYHDWFQGRLTASGDRYDRGQLTAAHRTLPFGTVACVTNLENGRAVEVRITDRGPHLRPRILDLSREAARRLDMVRAGVVRGQLTVGDEDCPVDPRAVLADMVAAYRSARSLEDESTEVQTVEGPGGPEVRTLVHRLAYLAPNCLLREVREGGDLVARAACNGRVLALRRPAADLERTLLAPQTLPAMRAVLGEGGLIGEGELLALLVLGPEAVAAGEARTRRELLDGRPVYRVDLAATGREDTLTLWIGRQDSLLYRLERSLTLTTGDEARRVHIVQTHPAPQRNLDLPADTFSLAVR